MKNTLFAAFSLLIFVSCVNSIDTEEELVEGNIPITLTTKSDSQSDNSLKFDEGDMLGLYATLSSSSLTKERYIDNLKMTSDGNNNLKLEKEIYFPDGGLSLDLVAYYPYRKVGLAKGSSMMEISVAADQQEYEDYISSYFLVAEKQNVDASDKAINLEMKHQLAKINLIIEPGADMTVDALIKSNLKLQAIGFSVAGEYDFISNNITLSSNTESIIPYGEWKIKDDKLIGKEFVVMPQTINQQILLLEWDGSVYSIPFPNFDMNKGTQCDVTIEANKLKDQVITSMSCTIKDWEDITPVETETNATQKAIYTSILSFDDSDIYRVYGNDQLVAEVCKEYLYKENVIDACAIVAYPIKDGNADLQNGLVLELLGNTGFVHGGKVEWSITDNTFSYIAGTANPIETIYIDKDYNIVTSPPTDTIDVKVKAYLLRDARGNNEESYPIVKVATQYWMKEDLRTNRFSDGTLIYSLSGLNGSVGYYHYNDDQKAVKDAYYYSGETLLAGSMAPSNWHVSNESDWDRLKNYLGNDASKIKGGAWGQINNNELQPATNETGLSILPNGLYIQDKSGYSYVASPTTHAAYWMCASNQQTLASQVMLFSSKDAGFELKSGKVSGKDYYQGLSIRCVKDMPY